MRFDCSAQGDLAVHAIEARRSPSRDLDGSSRAIALNLNERFPNDSAKRRQEEE
jgi:hypothetical protein